MIIFDLQCENNHKFEGWFEDSKTYENQKEKKLIQCPVCDSDVVYKIPSTFGIKASQSEVTFSDKKFTQETIAKHYVDFIEKNFDDVGCNFTKEALKIHYGVTKQRNIRGVSTQEEEKVLKKEGIQFVKIPMPKQSDTDS